MGKLAGRCVAVFPFIDGDPVGPGTHYPSAEDRDTVVAMLVRLHGCKAGPALRRDVHVIHHRKELLEAVDAEDRWDSGPYGEATRRRLHMNTDRLDALLSRYDELVSAVDPSGWVATHGEPHSGNVLRDASGVLHLADVDTMLLAPPERDLWNLTGALHGHDPRPDYMELYRLQWDLGEIAEYVTHFRRPHDGSPEDEIRWREVAAYLPDAAP